MGRLHDPVVSHSLPKRTRLTVPHMIGNTGVRSGLTETAIFGDSIVPRPNVELGGDQPLVVLANPLFNVTDEDVPDLHESLRGNRSYYFDGPERFETHERVFGFGPHGLETRIVGTTTDVFVEAVQQEMKKEIARLLRDDGN